MRNFYICIDESPLFVKDVWTYPAPHRPIIRRNSRPVSKDAHCDCTAGTQMEIISLDGSGSPYPEQLRWFSTAHLSTIGQECRLMMMRQVCAQPAQI